jgi:hypothetical protein
MKKEIVEFICDGCEKKKLVTKDMGFPYKEGWCYIHAMNGKVFNGKTVTQLEKSELHFHSTDCMVKYIKALFSSSQDAEISKSNQVDDALESMEDLNEEML